MSLSTSSSVREAPCMQCHNAQQTYSERQSIRQSTGAHRGHLVRRSRSTSLQSETLDCPMTMVRRSHENPPSARLVDGCGVGGRTLQAEEDRRWKSQIVWRCVCAMRMDRAHPSRHAGPPSGAVLRPRELQAPRHGVSRPRKGGATPARRCPSSSDTRHASSSGTQSLRSSRSVARVDAP